MGGGRADYATRVNECGSGEYRPRCFGARVSESLKSGIVTAHTAFLPLITTLFTQPHLFVKRELSAILVHRVCKLSP